MQHSIIVDWSKWQGNTNPETAVQNGAEGFIIRAGSATIYSGEPYKDDKFDNNSTECPKHAPTGTYWYVRLHLNWVGQMAFYINLIKNKPFLIRPCLDIEEVFDKNGKLIYYKTLQDRLLQCLEMLEDEFNVKPYIYTRTSIWNPYFKNPVWAKEYNLWVARYAFAEYTENVLEKCDEMLPYTSATPLPTPWQPDNYILWQCTADENKLGVKFGVPLPPYGTVACDASLTKGKMADFMLKAGMVEQIPPPIPPGDEMQYCKVTLPAGQEYRNMRSIPDSVYPGQGIDVGNVLPSDTSGDKTLPVLKIHTNSEGTWYLILKESENMKVGWVLAIIGSVKYLTLV